MRTRHTEDVSFIKAVGGNDCNDVSTNRSLESMAGEEAGDELVTRRLGLLEVES